MSNRVEKPSAGELELLGILWEYGLQSLSDVHSRMGRELGYTTVQTRLNRLVEKGLATSNKTGRQPTKYAAAIEPEEVGAGQLDLLVKQVTRGRVVPLVAHLVENNALKADELLELKRLLRQAEQRFKQQRETE